MRLQPIRKLNSVSAPRAFIFFDTESTMSKKELDFSLDIQELNKIFEQHHFQLGVAIFVKLDKKYQVEERQVFHFTDTNMFWKFVELKASKHYGLWIMSHNLKYDLINVDLIHFLERGEWVSEIPIAGNNFIMSMYKLKKVKEKVLKYRMVKFIDSFNYVKMSLKEIGKKFGKEKTQVNFDEATIDELFEYCQNDVEVVEKFMLNFVNWNINNNLGTIKYTIASTAFNIFRTSFNDESIFYHDDNELLVYEREAYHGGRVECFSTGKLPDQDYFLLDVNSMYVYIMANATLPTKPILKTDAITISELSEYTQDSYVIADVIINSDKDFPAYCIKHSSPETKEDKLIFPSGRFRTKLHNPELLNAIRNGQIEVVLSSVIYEHNKVLSKFANFFADMKKNATNSVDREFAKLIGNSAYGRLALRKYVTEVISIENADFFDNKHFSTKSNKNKAPGYFTGFFIRDDDTDEIQQFYRWGDNLYRQYTLENEFVKNTNVALAGAITAYSRMLLYSYMSKAGFENVFYLDTDSLLVNRAGYENLIPYLNDQELGMLKKEYLQKSIGEYSTRDVELFAPKWYQMGERKRSKGIAIDSQYHNGKYVFWRFSTFKDHLRSNGENFGRKVVAKSVKLEYNKGNVSDSGIVTPFRMEYDQWEKINKMI